jgi:iron complex outermembrane recepter protein
MGWRYSRKAVRWHAWLVKCPRSPAARFATALIAAAGLGLDGSPTGLAAAAELTEVLVTAQRRPERLRTVPIAASVLTGDQLERSQVTTVDQLQYAVPNLTNGPANVTRNALNLGIRGLAPRDNRPTVDPTVGVYLDDVYLGRLIGVDPATLDLERVEVLRGPQGTLYGRNTIGGAVNLVSRKPGTEPEGQLQLFVGNYSRTDLGGVLNLPWSDGQHAMRLAAALRSRGGFGSTPDGKALDDERQQFARLQYRFTSRANWDLNVAVDSSNAESGAQRRTLLAVAPSATNLPAAFGNAGDSLARYVDPHAQEVPVNLTGPVQAKVGGIAATLSAYAGRVTFKSISSYRWMDSSALDADLDGTPYDLASNRYRIDDQRQISQELQAIGTTPGGRLQWVGGLHHFREAGSFRQRVRTYVPGIADWNESLPSGDARNSATALYAQVDYAPLSRWKLTAGTRYNHEVRQLTSRAASVSSGVFACRLSFLVRDDPAVCRATLPERTFSFMPWTASVSFEPDTDAMYYLSRSRGIRSGGYNINGTGLQDLTTFEPERVTTWELGAKKYWMSGALQMHLALFNSKFNDIQLTEREVTNTGALGVAIIRNGGEASVDGAELEVNAVLRRVRATASFGWIQAEFTRLDPHVQEVALDSKFLQSPERTASASLEVPWKLRIADLTLRLDYAWRSTTWYDYPPESIARQPAFGLLNLQLTALAAQRPIEFSLWARNLTNTRYLVRAFAGDSISTAIPGDPRTVGLTVRYRWQPAATRD